MDLKELKSLSLTVGSVFRMTMYPSDGIQPKKKEHLSRNKYFVVIGIDDGRLLVGSVLINTDINCHKFNKVAPYNHLIYSREYMFLNQKDRYIDCFKVFEFDYERVMKEAEYIGYINQEDMRMIFDLIRDSPAVKPIQLTRYHI